MAEPGKSPGAATGYNSTRTTGTDVASGMQQTGNVMQGADMLMPGLGSGLKGVMDFGAGIASMFGGGGGSSQKGGYTLPPEYELQYLQEFDQWMSQAQQDYSMVGEAYNTFNDRVNTLNSIIEQGYSPERFQTLQDNTFRLSQVMGQDAEALASGGFITDADKADLAEMQKVASGRYQDVNNPVLEGQIQSQQRQLEQELARAGVPPSQRAIALSQFNQGANEARFGQAQQQFGLYGNLISQRAGLRQQGYNQAAGTLNQQMNYGQQFMGAYGQLGQNFGSQYSAMQARQAMQQGLRGEQQNMFTTMGQFKFSGQTKDALSSGLVGPGTMMQQTGVSGQAMDPYSDWVKKQERNYSMYGGQAPQYGAGNFRQSIFDQNNRNAQNRELAIQKAKEAYGNRNYGGSFGGAMQPAYNRVFRRQG